MATDIIQHHTHIDFDSLFENIKSRYVGIDYNDFSNFLHLSGEKHSFVGCADWKERVKNAFENAVGSDEAVGIISRASSVMITIIRSDKAERPLAVEEVKYLNEYVSGLPENCEVVWGLAEDDTLGNRIKVLLLVNITK